MRIFGISGSLRAGSWNTRLLEAAATMLPAHVTMEIRGVGDLPLYNPDIDGAQKPEPVRAFIERITMADALLFAVPEYNYSIPGGLKNAIDWASRPAYKSPLALKPAGLVSASSSPVGGARAQGHMKQVLGGTLTPVYPAPEFLVASAAAVFDGEGRIVDADVRARLERYVNGFVDWAKKRG